MKNYTLKELKFIAKVLNVLLLRSDHTLAVNMNTFHMSRFYSKHHYIDFNEKTKKCRVYKKDKSWEPSEEKF